MMHENRSDVGAVAGEEARGAGVVRPTRASAQRTGRLDRRTLVTGLLASALPLPAALGEEAPEDPFPELAARSDALDQLHAVVVLVNGETRFARAFGGPGLSRVANVKSVSKSIVALLTGIAIEKGLVAGPQATLGALIPDLIPDDADPRVEAITLADCLTMQAGLERTSGPNYGAWVGSDNWVRYALSRPFVAEPGARFQYSTGSYHILGVALARAADRSLLALAREWLGTPLGIEFAPWTRDPQGHYLGGNNMALTPEAMAKIGEMVRQGGALGGDRVVSAEWIETSFVARVRSPFSGDDYGYGFFLAEIGGERCAYARGFGGQMIYIFRDRPITVAVTSDPTRPARTSGHVGDLHALVADTILPAVSA